VIRWLADRHNATGGCMSGEEKNEISDKLRRMNHLLVEREGDSYKDLVNRLMEAQELFFGVLADRLAPSLNDHLTKLPQATPDNKKLIARTLNADLKALGLAIKCPRTGKPAMLHVDFGVVAPKGRFRVELFDRSRTMASQSLSRVELTRRPLRREALSEYWADRVSGGHSSEEPTDRGHA